MADEKKGETELYDTIIIGTGPAGYSAGIYAARYKMKSLVFGMLPGGTITEAHKVCNYPAMCDISGMELGQKMRDQVLELGCEEKFDLVSQVSKVEDNIYEVNTNSSGKFKAKTVIIATGTKRRKLGLEREKELTGKGVSYCATCDANFYKDKVVAVNGGADSANSASALLAGVAKKVYQIYRRDKLRGDQTWVDEVLKNNKIEVIYNAHITKLVGEKKLEAIELDDEYKGEMQIKVDGLFIEIGSGPESDIAKDMGCELDDGKYIKVAQDQATNLEGVFAAGDVTTASNKFQQVSTAVAEGAIAANSAYKYIKKRNAKSTQK